MNFATRSAYLFDGGLGVNRNLLLQACAEGAVHACGAQWRAGVVGRSMCHVTDP